MAGKLKRLDALSSPLTEALLPEPVNPVEQRIKDKLTKLQGVRSQVMEQLAGIDNQIYALDLILHPEKEQGAPDGVDKAPNDTPPGKI